ncbi:hypothetical protein BC832DRAFT_566374 [Gaertneriomyces semiglobifer]|nr:hypothetical protein BC832DRAFT_566374 [Gaertneriomyces semiglobifer]
MSVFHRNLFIGQVVARSAYRCIWGQSPPGTVKIHARRFVQRSQSSPPSERKSIPVGGLASLADTRESLPSDVAKFVAGYPSVVNISVQWGDQDAFAHVNNVTYIKYMEAARRVYFDQIVRPHMDHQAFDEIMDGNAIGLKTESLSCKYRSPCTYPDTVTVAVRSLLRKDGASQKFVYLESQKIHHNCAN